MNDGILYQINSWVIFVALFILFIIAAEVFFAIGLRTRLRNGEDAGSEVTTIQAAVLGLLALLLGFSFSMAMTRYDLRKQLVVEEANVIGTTYLRARMLPERQKDEICKLLRRYVDTRMEFYEAGMNRTAIRIANVNAERLQKKLWDSAIAAVKIDPNPVPTGLFVQSLNEVIDDHAKRIAAMENQVPEGILAALYIVAIFSFGLTGYACGVAGRRYLLPTVIAALLIALVIFILNDLDRPRQGIIKVSQQSMINLRDTLNCPSR